MPISVARDHGLGRGPPVVLGHPPNTFVAAPTPSHPLAARQASALAASASLEMLPREALANCAGDRADSRSPLPAGTEIYLTCLANANWQETAIACERLRAAGLVPVPHLAARQLASASDLDGRLAALAGVGVDRLLLIAGDRRAPAGPYADAAAVLDSGKLAQHGFHRIGFAAHPEGHPKVKPALLDAALSRKVEYAKSTRTALWLVTQFAFEAQPLVDFARRIALEHPGLPMRVGLPGPTKLRTLIGFARRCGTGASMRALTRRPGVVRLFGSWSPTALLNALADYASGEPGHPLAGIHLFTFGGIDGTLRWLKAMARCSDDGERAAARAAAAGQ